MESQEVTVQSDCNPNQQLLKVIHIPFLLVFKIKQEKDDSIRLQPGSGSSECGQA